MKILKPLLKSPPRSPQFAARLVQACDAHVECPPLHKGRQIWIRGKLAEEGLEVTVEAVRKWLSGEGRPQQAKAEILAKVLGVDATWLYMGTEAASGPRESMDVIPAAPVQDPILPIVIRPGMVVEVRGLPLDLTKIEAAKVANIVLAHAMVDSL